MSRIYRVLITIGFKIKVVAFGLTLAVISESGTAAQTNYDVQGLGIPTDTTSSAATGINNSGQICGYAGAGSSLEGILFSGGMSTVVPSIGGPTWQATAINASGQMAGSGLIIGSDENAFIFSGGNTVALGSLSGPLGTPISYGYGIDAAGDVVGKSGTNANVYHAFFYSAASQVMTDLSTLGGNSSAALGISPNGLLVVGNSSTSENQNHAFSYSTSTQSMTDIGTLGGTASFAIAANNSGHVVGYSTTTGNADTDAFYYDGTTMHDLGDPDGFGSFAQAINASNTVVGYYNSNGSGGTLAFVYSDGSFKTLDSLIPSNSGWTLQDATGINDAGDIVGYGLDPAGDTEAFELTPAASPVVPLPSAARMSLTMLGGLALVGFVKTLRRTENAG